MQNLLHLFQPRDRYIQFILFHLAFVLRRRLLYFWLPFGWLVTEAYVISFNSLLVSQNLRDNVVLSSAFHHGGFRFALRFRGNSKGESSIFAKIPLWTADLIRLDQDLKVYSLHSLLPISALTRTASWLVFSLRSCHNVVGTVHRQPTPRWDFRPFRKTYSLE